MLCDNCKEREVEIHLTKVENDTKVTLHLCKQCAQQKGLETGESILKSPLGGFIQAMGKGGASVLPTAADGLAARIGLEQTPHDGVTEAFAALDAGDQARALDLLLNALSSVDGARDDIRRVIVGILDELGVEDPLARESRRRLASALY